MSSFPKGGSEESVSVGEKDVICFCVGCAVRGKWHGTI